MNVDKTLTLALVNYHQGQLKIFGQHEELLIVRNGGEVQRMDTVDLGFPLALEEEISKWIAEKTFSLHAGDGIVLYTDGITEAENSHGELYGIERLCKVISHHWNLSSEEIKSAVIDDVLQHIDEGEILDDLTLVILKQQ
jgi:serine phosphatase RsbU (regulator of sigma subunit)